MYILCCKSSSYIAYAQIKKRKNKVIEPFYYIIVTGNV